MRFPIPKRRKPAELEPPEETEVELDHGHSETITLPDGSSFVLANASLLKLKIRQHGHYIVISDASHGQILQVLKRVEELLAKARED